MSIFPTNILLASDGSKEAELASRTAIDLANSTNSELHVITVGPFVAENPDPLVGGPPRTSPTAQELLDKQVELLTAAGGNIAQAHLKMGAAAEEIVALGEELGQVL